MSVIYRFQGLALNNYTEQALPGLSGHGDIGAASGGETAFTHLNISSYTMASRTVPILKLSPDNFAQAAYWSIRPNTHPSTAASPYTGAYSMRMYFRCPTTANLNANQTIFDFRNGSNIAIYAYATGTTSRRIRLSIGDTPGVLADRTAMYRVELQVDPARTPNTIMRLYLEDSTTALTGLTANATDTSWDAFRVGDFHSGTSIDVRANEWANIEIHDNYNLSGQFTSNPASPTAASISATGAPSVNPTIDSSYHYDTGTNATTPAASPAYDSFIDVDYTTAGTFNRKFNLFVPQGTAPAGGWPLICWAHSGFFTNGSKADLPDNWRDDLINAGYAVASIGYVRSSIDVANPYESYGSDNFRGGRYPSYILDYKRAAAYLRDNAATYGVNPSKIFATGFSAGGYIALAAMASRDLAADSIGTPLSLSAAATAGHPWADNYMGPDPEFRGVFVYAAPVDLDKAKYWDPTYPTATGVIRLLSYRFFQGLIANGASAPDAPHTAIQSMIDLNANNIKPVAYVRGSADYLIHWEHAPLLSTAMTSAGVSYDEYTVPNSHEGANQIYNRETIINWLNSVNSGGISTLHYDGISEIPVTISYYDGSVETPVTIEHEV